MLCNWNIKIIVEGGVEKNERFRKLGILEWIYSLQPEGSSVNYVQQESLEDSYIFVWISFKENSAKSDTLASLDHLWFFFAGQV